MDYFREGRRQRYLSDALSLAEIGLKIASDFPEIEVVIPSDQARLALSAWEREDGEEFEETSEEALLRSLAATWALIGLRVKQNMVDGDVMITLFPDEAARCMLAAEYLIGLDRGQSPSDES